MTASQQKYLRERLSQKMRKLNNTFERRLKNFSVLLDTSKLKIPKTLKVFIRVDSWTGEIKVPRSDTLSVDIRKAMKPKEIQDQIGKLRTAKALKRVANARADRIRDQIELGEKTTKTLLREIDGLSRWTS